MAHHDWPEDPRHGPVWHAVMSLLTIVAMASAWVLAGIALAAPR